MRHAIRPDRERVSGKIREACGRWQRAGGTSLWQGSRQTLVGVDASNCPHVEL